MPTVYTRPTYDELVRTLQFVDRLADRGLTEISRLAVRAINSRKPADAKLALESIRNWADDVANLVDCEIGDTGIARQKRRGRRRPLLVVIP